MIAFPDWQKYLVEQRRKATGNIPAFYEMMLRHAGAQGIDLDSFQDDFDLDKDGDSKLNNLASIAAIINQIYPQVKFVCESFPKGQGEQKLARIDKLVLEKRPVLLSLTLDPDGGWYHMPIVDAYPNSFKFLHHVDELGEPCMLQIPKVDIVNIHNSWKGGEEIAYLERF